MSSHCHGIGGQAKTPVSTANPPMPSCAQRLCAGIPSRTVSPEALGDLLARVRTGDIRALARAITLAEDDDGRAVLAGLIPLGRPVSHSGDPSGTVTVGITGPPGVGKSSLVDCMVSRYRQMGLRVGIVAVDPSSPFTGGAILGDRVRMQRHAIDRGVYIRSLGTRGSLGGLSRSAATAVDLIREAGFQVILIETVGIGQSEMDIMGLAETVVVVEAPGLGDEIQAIKAGIMEIGDVFVVNKADRPGVDRTVMEIESNLEFRHGPYRPPVVKCVAAAGKGMDEFFDALRTHRTHLETSGTLEERRRTMKRELFFETLREMAVLRVVRAAGSCPEMSALVSAPETMSEDAYTLARRVLDTVFPEREGLSEAWDATKPKVF